jgi:lipopolysaccharide/colanic/teichoic acid biosynthesis glycosyltransferase
MATQLLAHTGHSVAYDLRARAAHSRGANENDRRALNILVAAVGLVLTLPLMVVIAVLVKLTSPGPALYRQTRVGLNRRSARTPDGNRRRHRNLGGAPFMIYKFRTMRTDSGAEQVWALPGDSRVTSIGRILRKFRLDELPQLYNVLRGEMNVVGPRPEQPEIVAKLRTQVSGYATRQCVLPGITGWAQINHCYDRTIDDVRKKVDFDLAYIRRRSALEDAKIMLNTLPVMLGRKGGW